MVGRARGGEAKFSGLGMAHKLQTFCQQRSALGAMFMSTAAYVFLLFHFQKSDNQIYRMAAAGSLLTNLMEVGFYPLDTLNTQSKISEQSISLRQQMSKVFTQDGMNALCRGWSVTYYGSIAYGASYFFMYPWLKVKGSQLTKKKEYLPFVYFLSGMIAEYGALLIYFPFETVKVRIQSSSTEYLGLTDGLADIYRKEGISKMYKGYFWYAMHNGLNYSVQITFYETIMKYIK